MTVLFVVLPLAVLLSLLAAVAFVWAARRGQFDDLDTPAVRLLGDDANIAPEAPEVALLAQNMRNLRGRD